MCQLTNPDEIVDGLATQHQAKIGPIPKKPEHCPKNSTSPRARLTPLRFLISNVSAAAQAHILLLSS